MGLISKIIDLLGLTYDIAENTRETTTDVKSNKPKERHYDFDDGTGYTPEDYLKERKQRKKENKVKNQSENKTVKSTDDEGR